jgi:hypothetical protein
MKPGVTPAGTTQKEVIGDCGRGGFTVWRFAQQDLSRGKKNGGIA